MISSSPAPVLPAPKRGIHRGKAGLMVGLLLAAISLWLLGFNWRAATGLVAVSYDSALRVSAPFTENPQQTNVVIVYIDMASHDVLNQSPGKRWDRDLHAKLVRRLTRAGARAVVFDVIFDTPRPGLQEPAEIESESSVKADKAFAAAIRENGHVILASEFQISNHNTGVGDRLELSQIVEPIETFRKHAAGVGMAELATGRDFTVRFGFDGDVEGGNPSLSRETLEFLGKISTNDPARSKWLRYYGPPMSIKSVSYATALNALPELDALFRNRVVFVGARPLAGFYGDRRDELRCPLVPSSGRESFMPAVEVHATQLLNGMRDEGLDRWPLLVERWVFGVSGFLFGFGLLRMKLSWAFAVSGGCAALLLASVPVGVVVWDFWFPWLIPVAVQLPGALLVTVVVESTDWYLHRRRHELFRRQAEVRLREQAALLDKAQDAIVVQDLEGKTLYANPGATRLYGWTLESLERDGLPTDAVSVSETIRSQALAQTMDSGEWVGELEQLTRSGQRIYVQSRWTLIRDETGRPTSLLMINTDHTEKKRLEARFLQAQRMEAVGAIAGGMAHDLNNALAPVLLGLEMLRRQPQSEDTDQMLDAMQSNARRGTDMVRQVLLFARGEEGATELVNVRQLIRETERMLRPMIPRTIAVSTLVPGDIWPVRGNSTRLYQVLVNLCLNARDAMPTGGTLTLAVDNVEMDAEEAAAIRGASVGSYVAFTVADTGIGIAPENLEKVFEPFFTTKAADKGTGLGLTTVSHIVRAASGFIHVESELGVGTTFQVFLPKADTSNQTEMMRAIGDPRPCVVVVDDEHALHSLYSTTLEAHGFRTVVVPDMLEALEQIRRIGPARLVAVIIDGELPGTDSQQLLQAILGQNASVRIVWVRGPSAASPEADSVVVLQRPVLAEALVAAVVSKT